MPLSVVMPVTATAVMLLGPVMVTRWQSRPRWNRIHHSHVVGEATGVRGRIGEGQALLAWAVTYVHVVPPSLLT